MSPPWVQVRRVAYQRPRTLTWVLGAPLRRLLASTTMQRALVSEGKSWQALESDGTQGPGLRWVDIQDPDDPELQLLEKGFHFHPLAVEDCRHRNQRSKVEDYGDHTFVVLHTFAASPVSGDVHLTLHELHVFLRADLVVTVHQHQIGAVERLWRRASQGDTSATRGPGSVLHMLADEMVDGMYPVLEQLEEQLEDLAEVVLDRRPDPALLTRILEVRKDLLEMRRLLAPLREVLNYLTKMPYLGVEERDVPYFRNVLDHVSVMGQHLELSREHVADVRDLYLSAQASRANEIVKRLTVMATLGLPMTVITSFFGMNFEALPFRQPSAFMWTIAALVGMPAALLVFLRWRRWI